MTNQQHPITPPPELVQAFLRSNPFTPAEMTYEQFIATRFARWGADQELESCVNWSIENQHPRWARAVRAARRPKPPSLKEQALEQLRALDQHGALDCNTDKIRLALEQLDD